jgi:hypothetical protein
MYKALGHTNIPPIVTPPGETISDLLVEVTRLKTENSLQGLALKAWTDWYYSRFK